jgi:membrane protein required for colicin V production
MDRLHPVMPDELHDVLAPYIHNLDHDGLDLKYSHHDHDPDHDHDHHPKGDHGTGGFGSDSDPTHHDHNDILNRGAGDFGTPIDNHRIADDRHNDSSGLFQIDSDPNGSNDSTDEFLGSLPNSLDSGLRDLVFRAARNTKPQDRDELLSKLRSAVPELVGRVAREWQNGKPRASQVDTASRGTLLREISSIYTDFPDAQDTLIEDIETSLEGIPERVGMSVLKDWRSDLMAIKPDPDPETNHGTSLDARIIRHLETARVPLDSLGSRLQSRLRDVELR